MENLSYPYFKKAAFSKKYLALVFCGGLILTLRAGTNDSGLIINGLIHLEQTGATIFWWCFSLICVFGPILEIWNEHSLSRDGYQLRLTQSDLCVPTPTKPRQDRIVPFTAITGLTIEKDSTGRLLVVKHGGGLLAIYESCLPKPADLDTLHAKLDRSVMLADLKALRRQAL